MPQSARFQTERSQKLAVGVVTILVAAVALGAAHLFTRSHQRSWEVSLSESSVGNLHLLIPDGWKAIPDVTDPTYIEGPAVFVNSESRRLLTIGRLDVIRPASPESVLRAYLSDRVMKNARPYVDSAVVRRTRVGPFAVVRYQANSRIDQDTATTSERVIVFSEDGRRHWVITLSMPVTSNPDAELANDDMLSQMIASVRDLGCRDAEAVDFEQAMVPAKALGDWQGRVEAGPMPGQAVVLSPRDTQSPHLAVLRVIGEVNTDEASIESIQPAEKLKALFEELLDQSPDPELLKPTRVGNTKVWRLAFSDRPESLLRRELIFAAQSSQRGILIDALAERDAWPSVQEEIDALVLRLSKLESDGAASPAGGSLLDASINKGDEVAKMQRNLMLDPRSQGMTFWRLQRGGQTVGAQIVQIHHVNRPDYPVVCHLVGYYKGENRLHKSSITTLISADGSAMQSEIVRLVQLTAYSGMYAFRVALDQGKLTMWPYPMVGVFLEGWNMPEPKGFLPTFAEENWDFDAVYNLASAHPVLVWRSAGEEKPEPCWLSAARLEGNHEFSDPELAKATGLITLRPMMSTDASRIWLDDQGRILRGEWFESAGYAYGGIRFVFAPSTQQAVQELFPDSEKIIKQLKNSASQP